MEPHDQRYAGKGRARSSEMHLGGAVGVDRDKLTAMSKHPCPETNHAPQSSRLLRSETSPKAGQLDVLVDELPFLEPGNKISPNGRGKYTM
jgi:hypothetical protein